MPPQHVACGYTAAVSDPLHQTADLLQRLAGGDAAAGDELFPLVYRELHGVAHRLMAKERGGHTLQTTALMHEAWMRLIGTQDSSFADRRHFLRVAARAMRNVLVDHARRRNAKKRQGGRAEPLIEDALAYWESNHHDLLALDEGLTRLGERDENLLRVVELRFFAGLTNDEAAEVLGLSPRQCSKAWAFARSWLRREMDRGLADG